AQNIGEGSTVGMKLLGAESREESMAILDQMEIDQEARKEAMREFLNSEKDFETYEKYAARQSEYQQLGGIRSVMDEIGEPLSFEQEERLVDAMYAARVESGMVENWEGRAGFLQHGRPGTSDRFETDWNEMQSDMEGDLQSILSGAQREAFLSQQEQTKGWVLMQIRMVEGMIEAARKENRGN
ncbi:MAG: hypothetical protein AAGC74_11710, partial [Verrucomicrobiota bacterium]